MSDRGSHEDSQCYRLLAHQLVISVLKNMDSLLKSLQDEFIQSVEERISSETKPKESEKKGRQPANHLILTEEQEYHNGVFGHTSNLIQAVERLEEVPFYLARFPNYKTFQKRGITLYKWIQYHYSNYLISGVSIYDTTLLLTNAVFMLGLHPRDCNDRTVTKNQNVRKTLVKAAIEDLDKVTQGFREPRNLYVHRNIMPHLEVLDRLERFRFTQEGLESLGIAESVSEPIIHPIVRKELYKLERRELIKTIRAETVAIADSIRSVFDTLYPVYLAYTESLGTRRAS